MVPPEHIDLVLDELSRMSRSRGARLSHVVIGLPDLADEAAIALRVEHAMDARGLGRVAVRYVRTGGPVRLMVAEFERAVGAPLEEPALSEIEASRYRSSGSSAG